MCLAVPGKVIKREGMKLTVEYPGVTNFAMDGGVEVVVGDYVMVQMGVVMKKLDKQEVVEMEKAWEERG